MRPSPAVPDRLGDVPRKQRSLQKVPLPMEFEGQTYNALYYVEHGLVTVVWGDSGSKIGRISVSPEETARMLFRELLRSAKARGNL